MTETIHTAMGSHVIRPQNHPHTSPALRDGLGKPKLVKTETFSLEKRAPWGLQRPQEHCWGDADSVGSRVFSVFTNPTARTMLH